MKSLPYLTCINSLAAALFVTSWNSSAAVVDDRLNERLNQYISSSYPAGTDVWEQSALALAIFKQWATQDSAHRGAAQSYIDQVCAIPIPATGEDFESYFKLPLLVRIYLDPALSTHMTASNKVNIESVMWKFCKSRSDTDEGRDSVWYISGSENHDMIRKSLYLTGSLIQENAGYPFGTTFDDGNPISGHLATWKKYLYEYFRQRAREGMNCEIASLAYNKYTLGCWYNIRDLMATEDPALSNLADKAITLFWAAAANDFVPATGYRGASGSRWYKDSTANGSDSTRDILYCYTWHNTAVKLHPFNVIAACSPYRQPGTVTAIGSDANRTPYKSTTRHFGKGANGIVKYDSYLATFGANNASDIVRQTWWNPNYVIGGLTMKTDATDYTLLNGQNRSMGVYIANPSDKDDRVMFFGNGTRLQPDRPPPFQDGSFEISGLAAERCLVAAWDKNATQNAGVRVFLSDGAPLTNKIDNNGWIFTWAPGATESVFIGIKICNGTYTTTSNPLGNLLEFSDKFSPVIIEVASPSDLPAGQNNFGWFQIACVANWTPNNPNNFYDTAAKKLTYTSLAGDKFEYWANSSTLPKLGLNGVTPTTVNLNPSKTYNTPYLVGEHGSDIVTITYPGQPPVVLDFNFKDSPLWDDYQTKGLWHMDTISSGKILDDDKFNTTRNNDLTLFGGATVSSAKFSNGLILDGVNDYAKAATQWLSYPTAKIDFWFKPTETAPAARAIVAARTTWEFQQLGSDLRLWVWFPNCGFFPHALTVPNGATPNVWHHATGTISTSGGTSTITLTVDNLAPQTLSGTAMSLNNADLFVGFEGGSRWYKGMVDDLKVRIHNLQ